MPYFLDLKDDNGTVYSIPSITDGYAEGTVKNPGLGSENKILFGDNTWTDTVVLQCGSSSVNI